MSIPVTATGAPAGVAEWIRRAAGAINGLLHADAALGDYANDAAAETAGVPIGGRYRNGSVLMVRVS